jgi:hypothetical protein
LDQICPFEKNRPRVPRQRARQIASRERSFDGVIDRATRRDATDHRAHATSLKALA